MYIFASNKAMTFELFKLEKIFQIDFRYVKKMNQFSIFWKRLKLSLNKSVQHEEEQFCLFFHFLSGSKAAKRSVRLNQLALLRYIAIDKNYLGFSVFNFLNFLKIFSPDESSSRC